VPGFSIFNFFLILLCSVAIGLGGYFIWQQFQTQRYYDLLIQGMLSENIGNNALAVDMYKEAEQMFPGKPLAYRFLSELYLSRKQYNLADIESKRWEIASPGDGAIGEFRMRMKAAEEEQARRMK
jgi:hypothetical protein